MGRGEFAAECAQIYKVMLLFEYKYQPRERIMFAVHFTVGLVAVKRMYKVYGALERVEVVGACLHLSLVVRGQVGRASSSNRLQVSRVARPQVRCATVSIACSAASKPLRHFRRSIVPVGGHLLFPAAERTPRRPIDKQTPSAFVSHNNGCALKSNG